MSVDEQARPRLVVVGPNLVETPGVRVDRSILFSEGAMPVRNARDTRAAARYMIQHNNTDLEREARQE